MRVHIDLRHRPEVPSEGALGTYAFSRVLATAPEIADQFTTTPTGSTVVKSLLDTER